MMRVILTRDCVVVMRQILPYHLAAACSGRISSCWGGHCAPWNSTSLRLPSGEESIAEVSLTPDRPSAVFPFENGDKEPRLGLMMMRLSESRRRAGNRYEYIARAI
jgi:hypothetical protein